MKLLFALIALFSACFTSNTTLAQSLTQEKGFKYEGALELIIDVSQMKEIRGKFMLMIGGQLLYPTLKNNMLVVNTIMNEPRRAFLAFYPDETIAANPGKPLNHIAAAYSDNFTFLGTAGKIRILVKGTLINSEFVNLTRAQNDYRALLKLKDGLDRQLSIEQGTLQGEIRSATDKILKDSLMAIYIKHYQKCYQDSVLGFVKNHPNSPASLIELEEYSYMTSKDLKLLTLLYSSLTDRMKALPTGKRIYNVVNSDNFAIDSLIGKPAPNFSQTDTAGKTVSLSDFKGNVTLIEFWASWCGPCRESNPALVKTYQKFSGKGFKILGVSLDENKQHWLKAIKNDNLAWTHVSDLNFWKNSAAILYRVVGVPYNVLIDESGKVLATNVNDESLDKQLNRLLLK